MSPSSARALLSVPLALCVLVAIEVAQLPAIMFWAAPSTVVGAASEVTVLAGRYLLWPMAYLLLVVGIHAAGLGERSRRLWNWFGLPIVGSIPTLHAYQTLVEYPAFAGYLPFVGLFALLWLFSWVVPATAGWRPGTRRASTLLSWLPGTAGLVGAVVVSVLNYRMWKNTYETLHLSMLEVTVVLLGLGMLHLSSGVRPPKKPRTWILLTVMTCVALVLAAVAQPTGFAERLRPYIAVRSILGRTHAIRHPVNREPDVRPALEPDPNAEARLREAFPLPALPEDFELRRKNILLIVSEATRFDATSLANGSLDTTPNLVRLKEMGAYSFESAISPSSVTLDSMSSLLTMRFPSACELETWDQLWKGDLSPNNVTVTERLAASGYSTFWAGHNYRKAMTQTILGLGQGFERRSLIPIDPADTESERAFTTDRRIARAAIRSIDRATKGDKPFFGLVFFGSPHRPYLARNPDDEDDPYARYLGEVTYMDSQLGMVLDHVQERGLLEDTILIFLSDHGEEFLEHGGERHGRTLYIESVHVPLLVRFPGVSGDVIKTPVSTLYLFPWLLLHDQGELREAALEQLRTEIGPMLRETDSAVVSELFGNDRMLSSLIYPGTHLIYDFMTGLYRVFDTREDPREERDLMLYEPERAEAQLPPVDRYLGVRASIRRATVAPEKRRATPEDLAAHRQIGRRGREKVGAPE